jgi:hypoxanthine phosphoribosyltransferase
MGRGFIGQKMHRDLAEIIIDEETIQARVAELADQISKDYEGKELFLVGVLKGAAIFLSDLVRRITVPLTYDFVAIQSYGSSTKSSGVVRILKDLEDSVESKHVLVVEDIVDTGLTMRVSYLIDNLRSRKAASVKVCALLDRPGRRIFETEIDYTGFVVPNKFVVGYGLDYQERYRSLPYIGILKPEIYGGG